jgi:EthD domain-containing protein
MLKVIATVVRRANISHEELVKVWEEVHAPHVKKIAQPERYRVTFFDPQQAADDPGLDGMAELWFRDKRHLDTTLGREAPPEILADRFNEYADLSKGTWLSVTEHVNVDGPTTRETTKLVYFVKRREGVERSALDRYWLDTHVPNVTAALRRTPSARRYTVDLVDPARERVYDGIAQISLEGPHPSFSDVQNYVPDGFSELIQPLLMSRGHEIRIVG